MKKFNLTLTPEQINSRLGAEMRLVQKVNLNNAAQLNEADYNSMCFYENPKYLEHLKKTTAGLILVPIDFERFILPETNLIFVDKPYYTFMLIIKTWLQLDSGNRKPVISESAFVAESVKLGKNVSLGHN